MPSTRERIIMASSALFMQQGYAASGLKQIAQESEATIGSLYHFFPGGKEQLAEEGVGGDAEHAHSNLDVGVAHGSRQIGSRQ